MKLRLALKIPLDNKWSWIIASSTINLATWLTLKITYHTPDQSDDVIYGLFYQGASLVQSSVSYQSNRNSRNKNRSKDFSYIEIPGGEESPSFSKSDPFKKIYVRRVKFGSRVCCRLCSKRKFKGALSGLRQYLASESPLKMMRMVFISPLKRFSFSRYFSFCLDLLVMYKSGLMRKIRKFQNLWRHNLVNKQWQ